MSVEGVIEAILVPIIIAIMTGMWLQIDGMKKNMATQTGKIWIDLATFKDAYARNRLEDERRYVNRDNLAEFKEEVKDSLSEVKKSVDKLVDKMENNTRGSKTG